MGFFKDLRGDTGKSNEKITKADKKDTSVVKTTELTNDNENYFVNDMQRSPDQLESADAKSTDVNFNKMKDDRAEDTMVDYDDNAVDSEILDTLLNNGGNEQGSERMNQEANEKESGGFSGTPDFSNGNKDDMTIITKGTTINGNIISECSLNVMGTINGDIECSGKLSITGKVTGNSMASEVYVSTQRLEGCISSEGGVQIGKGTVVIGDITASSAIIAGAIKGEIDINGPVIIDSTAIIKGNIKAKAVQMNSGAVVEGFVSLCYADIDLDNIFK